MINKTTQDYFLVALLVGTLLLTFFIFQPFLYAIVFAIVFAVVFKPVHQKILSLVRGREWLGAILTLLAILVFIVTPLMLLAMQVFQEAGQLYASLSDSGGGNGILSVINTLVQEIQKLFPGTQGFSFDIHQYTKQGLAWLLQNIGFVFSNVTKIMMSFFVFLIAFFYLLKDGDKMKNFVVMFSPLADSDDEAILKKLEGATNSVVKGNLTVAAIQGTMTAIGFTIFGIPNPIFWGSIAVIAALIPGVGTMLVLAPAIVFLFFTGNTIAGFGLLAWAVGAVGFIDNFLGPKLVGRGAKLHPLLVLLAVLGGIIFFGPIGIILGPLTVSFLLALVDIHLKNK
jgi:predicted PurR-regulated permease PerM